MDKIEKINNDSDDKRARSFVNVCFNLQKEMLIPSPSKKQCTAKLDIKSSSQASTNSPSTLPDLGKCNISDQDSITITGEFKNVEELEQKIFEKGSPTSIILDNCSIKTAVTEALPQTVTLKNIKFEKCDENIFKAFSNQPTKERIEIRNEDWTWNGFPHDFFNEMCKNCQKLDNLVLKGAGTGSYFDADEFPYKITKLETTMITFHWYVGIRTQRIKFLKSQLGHLKELTIHKLPYDFDGGEVLKYIIDEMKLKTFNYGKIPLILNGKKQKVKAFTASDIQITSAYEMINQFSSIEKLTLKLSNTEIACEDIEKIINPSTDIFKNIKEFEVIDHSKRHLGVFLGLFKNLKNVQKIILKSNDKNVYKIINLLPQMKNLKEIQLISTMLSSLEIDTSKFAPDFKFTKIMDNDDVEPQGNVGDINRPAAQNNANAPGGGNAQRENEDDDVQGNRQGGGGGDDDNNRNNISIGWPQTTITGTIVEKDKLKKFKSALNVQILPEAENNYYYIHVSGFYRIILNKNNLDQLEELLGRDLTYHIYMIFIERGKIKFKFLNDIQAHRDLIHDKIIKLAFVPDMKDVQLRLITLPGTQLITVNCYIKSNMDWHTFRTNISFPNGLSASFWIEGVSVPVEGRGYRWTFDIDGKSCSQIQELNNQLRLKDGTRIIIEVEYDPYRHDIDRLPF